MAGTPTISTAELPAKRVAEPCSIIVFGAAGDLARRRLMPSLFHLYRGDHIHEKTVVIGVDRAELTQEAFRKDISKGHARAPGYRTMMLPKAKDWDEFTQ